MALNYQINFTFQRDIVRYIILVFLRYYCYLIPLMVNIDYRLFIDFLKGIIWEKCIKDFFFALAFSEPSLLYIFPMWEERQNSS